MRGNVKETLLGSPYRIILLWGFQVYWKLNFEIRGGMHLGNCKKKMLAKHSLYVKNVMECFCTKREIHQEIILCRKKRRSISPLASTRREERNALVLRSLLIYSIQRGWKSGKWMLDVCNPFGLLMRGAFFALKVHLQHLFSSMIKGLLGHPK